MNLGTKSILAALALSGSTVALAQVAPTVAPQTPAKAKTTTTQSTTTAQPVTDATGTMTAVQKTTETTQTTATQPATTATPTTTSTTSTTTMGTDPATGAPAATTTTTTTEPATDAKGAAVTAATEADFKAGVPVFDQKGGVVGKVESVSAKGAVVSTGKARAEIPTASFGKNDKGLVMSMTKSELEAAAAPKKK